MDNLAALLRDFLEAYLRRDFDKVLPAVVETYDKNKNRVSVTPMAMMVDTKGKVHHRPTIASLPVLRLGGGGFFISVPIVAGDKGWILAADRDISAILAKKDEAAPPTDRVHSFSDAFFIPDSFASWAAGAKYADALVIQSMNGSTAISVKDGEVEIEAAKIKVKGDLEVSGAVKANGEVTALAITPVTAVGLSTHEHPSAAVGPPSPPTPGT